MCSVVANGMNKKDAIRNKPSILNLSFLGKLNISFLGGSHNFLRRRFSCEYSAKAVYIGCNFSQHSSCGSFAQKGKITHLRKERLSLFVGLVDVVILHVLSIFQKLEFVSCMTRMIVKCQVYMLLQVCYFRVFLFCSRHAGCSAGTQLNIEQLKMAAPRFSGCDSVPNTI